MTSRPTHATTDGLAYLSLQRLARQTRRNTQDLLRRYALEGFLARLAASPQASHLVLKGGVLLAAYGLRRATRDIDLQARQIANDVDTVLALARDIARIEVDDGLDYRIEAATAATIREDDVYQGIRITVPTRLATARLSLHVDVNVGDPIWPRPRPITLPGLLGRNIVVRGYPLSMVYAEKLVTALDRGPTNTRWRDFADVYMLTGYHSSDAAELDASIGRVARHRAVLAAPLASTLDGWAPVAQARWETWLRKQDLPTDVPTGFDEVLAAVVSFADPVLTGTLTRGTWNPLDRRWTPVRHEG